MSKCEEEKEGRETTKREGRRKGIRAPSRTQYNIPTMTNHTYGVKWNMKKCEEGGESRRGGGEKDGGLDENRESVKSQGNLLLRSRLGFIFSSRLL